MKSTALTFSANGPLVGRVGSSRGGGGPSWGRGPGSSQTGIIWSSAGRHGVTGLCREIGIAANLTEPVDTQVLLEVIHHLTRTAA